jgi:hypothetical protein
MPANVIDIDEVETPSFGVAEIPDRVWMRTCPQCNLLLFKTSDDETAQCVCGWEWQY